MKALETKVLIIAFTFLIGVLCVAVWFFQLRTDSNVYSVKFCDLMKESKAYDGKNIKIRTLYKQGYEASFLIDTNCNDSITATCYLSAESCDKIFNSLRKSSELNQVKTVIGKYRNSEYDSFDGNVHKLEILEVEDN